MNTHDVCVCLFCAHNHRVYEASTLCGWMVRVLCFLMLLSLTTQKEFSHNAFEDFSTHVVDTHGENKFTRRSVKIGALAFLYASFGRIRGQKKKKNALAAILRRWAA